MLKNTIAYMVRRTALRHPTKSPDPLGVLTKGQHVNSVQVLDGLGICLLVRYQQKLGYALRW
ncbi:MAG: hypothetical protein ACOX7C_08435 [Brevefilum sp.]